MPTGALARVTRRLFRPTSLALGAALLLAGGCGGNDEDSIKIVPVTGTVTLDGKPLEGANIAFVPDPSNAKPQTDGGDVTGSGGTFDIKYRNRSGVAPGKYVVVVTKPGAGGAGAAPKTPEDIAKSPYMAGLTEKSVATKKEPPPWPYGDAKTSQLKHEVSANGDKDLKFDLKSSAR